MLRIFIIATILFANTDLQAQGGVGGFVDRVAPGPVRPSQVIPKQLDPPAPEQVVPKELAPDKVVPQVQKAVEPVVKETGKLIEQGIKGTESIVAGAPGIPGVSGSPVSVDCPLNKLVDAATSLENMAKSHADEIKKFNDQMAATAKSVNDAQLSIIKKTVEEAGNFLLNPFKPLIDIVKNYKKYYDDLIEAAKTLAWKFVLVIGTVLGFMIGLPFWIFIRAITPRRKAA